MPLPVDMQTGTITGRFVDIGGTALQGTISFTPNVPKLYSKATGTTIVVTTRKVPLAPDGTLSVVLPATNDPDVTPAGFQYAVVEDFQGKVATGFKYNISVPQGSTVDLADISPSVP